MTGRTFGEGTFGAAANGAATNFAGMSLRDPLPVILTVSIGVALSSSPEVLEPKQKMSVAKAMTLAHEIYSEAL